MGLAGQTNPRIYYYTLGTSHENFQTLLSYALQQKCNSSVTVHVYDR